MYKYEIYLPHASYPFRITCQELIEIGSVVIIDKDVYKVTRKAFIIKDGIAMVRFSVDYLKSNDTPEAEWSYQRMRRGNQ